MAKLSILQISDLHRDPANPIRNDVLLTSLDRDRDRYISADDPKIRTPDIIIVSGDLVQGIWPGTPNAAPLLAAQYAEAMEFLTDLTDRFVGGDRTRVILIPGNHDVDACKFAESIKPVVVQPDRKKDIVGQLFTPGSRMRWSWHDLEPYEISDDALYAERLAAFAKFYGEFYHGRRTYNLDPAKQFDLFDLPDLGVVIVGFSSCYNNDIYNTQGAIHPGAIAGADKALRDTKYNDRLRLAVWHHNTEGSPTQTDYMPAGILQNLIDCGFSLGFHGHQHRPQCLDTRFRYGANRRITVISAGTLCGSASYNHGRAYNIVEIDTAQKTGLLHVRESQNAPAEIPIWGRRAITTDKMTLDFQFDGPPEPLNRTDSTTQNLITAQSLYFEKRYDEAAEYLRRSAGSDELSRRLLLDCLTTLKASAEIIARFDPPQSAAEILALMDALWQEKRLERLRMLLAEPSVAASLDASVVEFRKKYQARLSK